MDDKFVQDVLSNASKASRPAKSVIYKRVRDADEPRHEYGSAVAIDRGKFGSP